MKWAGLSPVVYLYEMGVGSWGSGGGMDRTSGLDWVRASGRWWEGPLCRGFRFNCISFSSMYDSSILSRISSFICSRDSRISCKMLWFKQVKCTYLVCNPNSCNDCNTMIVIKWLIQNNKSNDLNWPVPEPVWLFTHPPLMPAFLNNLILHLNVKWTPPSNLKILQHKSIYGLGPLSKQVLPPSLHLNSHCKTYCPTFQQLNLTRGYSLP